MSEAMLERLNNVPFLPVQSRHLSHRCALPIGIRAADNGLGLLYRNVICVC